MEQMQKQAAQRAVEGREVFQKRCIVTLQGISTLIVRMKICKPRKRSTSCAYRAKEDEDAHELEGTYGS